jgi:hypothetical protein
MEERGRMAVIDSGVVDERLVGVTWLMQSDT